jgi:uncharacterized protein
MNLLDTLTTPVSSAPRLTWDPAPLGWEPLPGGGIRVQVPAGADYFQDPAGVVQRDSAPFLGLPVRGDFVARAHVRPAFNSTYDSGVLMVRADPLHWAKICFESTDFGTTAAVSVVTNGVSDDANGVDLSVPDLWLQMCRVGNAFGLQYALDGSAGNNAEWRMVRAFRLDLPAEVRVGVVTQCPVGPGTTVDVLHFSLEARTVSDLRAGK